MLRELGQRLELEGGNPYRARAYGRAAENLSLISVPVDQLVAEGRLKEIPGIGARERRRGQRGVTAAGAHGGRAGITNPRGGDHPAGHIWSGRVSLIRPSPRGPSL
ncbi:MAG TPA: helix-hairpin-helix domain-containing protein [Reyranella sp.]|nr:helix-hairpin-helix domain-containing protein [Reyranella sp.]